MPGDLFNNLFIHTSLEKASRGRHSQTVIAELPLDASIFGDVFHDTLQSVNPHWFIRVPSTWSEVVQRQRVLVKCLTFPIGRQK